MGFGLVRWVVMSGVTLFLLPSFALPADKDIPESLLPSLERVWKMQDREMEKLQGQLREASASNSPNRRTAMAKIKKQITYIRNGGVPLIELKAWELREGDVGQFDIYQLRVEVKKVVDNRTVVIIPVQRVLEETISEYKTKITYAGEHDHSEDSVSHTKVSYKPGAAIILFGWPAHNINEKTDFRDLGWFQVLSVKSCKDLKYSNIDKNVELVLVPLDTKSLAPHLKKRPKTTT